MYLVHQLSSLLIRGWYLKYLDASSAEEGVANPDIPPRRESKPAAQIVRVAATVHK